MDRRKNVNSLTPPEKTRFVKALNALKSKGLYTKYVTEHADMTAMLNAHRGPAFFPWHRHFLRRLELELQGEEPGVTLPYWDWAHDSALANPSAAAVWQADLMGGDGSPITTGPFTGWTTVTSTGQPSGKIRRELGANAPTLPSRADVWATHDVTPYDSAPWNVASNPSFRNRSEGWSPNPPAMHNRVHVWVGGDMLPMTSPNDPVFFLHHCNVDRLWAEWQTAHGAQNYQPTAGAATGHNLNDQMTPFQPVTAAHTLDFRAMGYTYDTLDNLGDGRPFWQGDFSHTHKAELLSWNPGDRSYWVGRVQTIAGRPQLKFTFAANSFGFQGGEAAGVIWPGDFTGAHQDQILFYSSWDANYWLGQFTGTQLQYSLAGNTAGFQGGETFSRVWTGNFTGAGKREILFWHPNDRNYWLGRFAGNQIQYSLAANTAGFQGGERIGLIWVGDFTGAGKDQLLFYAPPDQNYWLGQFTGTQLQYTLAGNTAGFQGGETFSRLWTGNFTGAGRQEILFWHPNDRNYWLGRFSGNQIQYALAANTAGFQGGERIGLIWVGDFTGAGKDQLLFYAPPDQNYWLGQFTGTQLQYTPVGNTAGFAGGEARSRVWIGDFEGVGHKQVLFYHPPDGNWWLGDTAGGQIKYSFVGNGAPL